MKRFEWRLQRVLDVKKKLERAKQAEVAELRAKVEDKRRELVAEEERLWQLLTDLAAVSDAERVQSQAFFASVRGGSDSRIARLKNGLEKLEVQRQEKMSELLELRQKNEAMERLREKSMTSFLEEQNKAEQNEIDEIASMGFVRNS